MIMNLFINHFNKSTFKQAFMKQKLFGAAALVAFILAGASCTKQEQSEFNFDAVNQEITLSATVTYNTGVEVNGANYSIANAKPAAGRKVTVEVPMASYVAGAQGSKLFETVTDANGYFTIAIPVKSNGINGVNVYLEQFTDFYNEYESMGADGKPIIKSLLKRYSWQQLNINLVPGNYEFPNRIEYVANNADVEQFDNIVTFKGQIKLAIEKGFRIGDYKNASNANVEFSIAYPANAVSAAANFTFGTTTDAEGNYTINIPVRSLSEGLRINALKVLGVGDNAFVHYTDSAETISLYGAYEVTNFAAPGILGLLLTDFVDGMPYNLGTRYLAFNPYFNNGITQDDGARPAKWEDNLIGWARGKAGFQNYDQTVTIKGRIHLAALEGFGKGIFTEGAQAIVINGPAPYNQNFKAYTDKAGNFKVDIPTNDYKVAADFFNITLAEEDQPFTFIDSKGKETILRDGLYDNYNQIKPENADWDEYGDYYVMYTPDPLNTPDEWSDDLIGWKKAQGKDKFVEVKGKVLFAVEKGYGIGAYEPQARIVTVTDVTTGENYDVMTSAEDGTFSFNLPMEDDADQLNIALVQANVPVKDFAHYTEYGKTTPVYIADDYNNYTIVYADKDHKWNDLGTAYVKFNDQFLAAGDDTWHENLAGWLKLMDINDVEFAEKATIKGAAKLNVETGFLAGDMIPAEGYILEIVVPGLANNVQVLTDNKGEFSFVLPLENAGEEPNVDFDNTVTIPVEKFTHYKDADKKFDILTNGEYDCTGRIIKKEGHEWTDLGTAYYQYIPDPMQPAPAMWDALVPATEFAPYIAGWKVIDGWDLSETVTGTVFKAKETKARTGEYEKFAGMPVKINIAGELYTAATDANGKFSIKVLKQFPDDEFNPVFVDAALSSDDYGKFKHFREVGNTANFVLLDGNYNHVLDRVNDEYAAWNIMGEYYYKFTPNAAPGTWDNNLVGWLIAPDGEYETININGKVQWAIEEWSGSSAAAKWQSVGYSTATVTTDVDGVGYNVPVEDGKIAFSFKVAKDAVPDKVAITIAPDDIEVDEFKHWTDKNKNNTLEILHQYTFTSQNNVNAEDCDKSATGNIYAPKAAAKLKLKFDAQHLQPDGWTQYIWNVNQDAE